MQHGPNEGVEEGEEGVWEWRFRVNPLPGLRLRKENVILLERGTWSEEARRACSSGPMRVCVGREEGRTAGRYTRNRGFAFNMGVVLSGFLERCTWSEEARSACSTGPMRVCRKGRRAFGNGVFRLTLYLVSNCVRNVECCSREMHLVR